MLAPAGGALGALLAVAWADFTAEDAGRAVPVAVLILVFQGMDVGDPALIITRIYMRLEALPAVITLFTRIRTGTSTKVKVIAALTLLITPTMTTGRLTGIQLLVLSSHKLSSDVLQTILP